MNTPREFDPVRAAVLFGVFVGLGIVVDAGFFLFAAAIAITALVVKVGHVIHEHSEHTQLAYRTR